MAYLIISIYSLIFTADIEMVVTYVGEIAQERLAARERWGSVLNT